MVKLKEAGVGDKVLNWIEDWLKGRKQRVRVEDELSEWIEVLSSVVQGSVLGGILFDIFIDDIDDAAMEALVWKFTDDTKASEDDCKRMQEIIDSLAAWAQKWGMAFNVKKCKVLHVGRSNPKFKYFMNDEEVEAVKDEKDLGIHIEDTMKPTKQCAAAAKEANFTLGQIQRAFHYRILVIQGSHMVSGTRCPAGSDLVKRWSESRAAAPKGRCPVEHRGEF